MHRRDRLEDLANDEQPGTEVTLTVRALERGQDLAQVNAGMVFGDDGEARHRAAPAAHADDARERFVLEICELGRTLMQSELKGGDAAEGRAHDESLVRQFVMRIPHQQPFAEAIAKQKFVCRNGLYRSASHYQPRA
jgi:hypothetical protein